MDQNSTQQVVASSYDRVETSRTASLNEFFQPIIRGDQKSQKERTDSAESEVGHEDQVSPSPEWRAEAILRLLTDVTYTTKDSGTSLRDCLVPIAAIDTTTNELREMKNDYFAVRIGGKTVRAHMAMAILVGNRFPRRTGDPETDEVAMHLCNNPACRHPLHIKLGTARENREYCAACNRLATGTANGHSTQPDKTPRGESHYQFRWRSMEERELARMLLKKYDTTRGAPRAIAEYLNCSLNSVNNLKKNRGHLAPEVGETEVELKIVPRQKAVNRKNGRDAYTAVVADIRRRFHAAPSVARIGLLLQFMKETNKCEAAIRNWLLRRNNIYPDAAPEIPVPTDFGPGTRAARQSRASK